MKLAIIGSRSFHNFQLMQEEFIKKYDPKDVECIISGGASGADKMAEKLAAEYKIPTKIFRANWSMFGKQAGFLRNHDIISNADEILVFMVKEGSRGTQHSISIAKDMNKPLKIIYF